jgi:hypothetical protein
MEQPTIISHSLYRYYYPVLQRYARRIVKDDRDAATLANEVLQEQFELYGFEGTLLRRRLKQALQLHCYYYLQARIFDKPMIKGYLPASESKMKRSSTLK